jgi:DNA-binding NarL/FixJ family response regulator
MMAELTERERQVAQLLRAGRSNKQIAAELGVSRDRVKELVAQVCRKVGAANRTQAAAALEALARTPPKAGE